MSSKGKRKQTGGGRPSSKAASNSKKPSPSKQQQAAPPKKSNSDLPDASYLITCDIPTKQYIHYLDEIKSLDKKFILEELDETHLLIKLGAKVEIEQAIEKWMDENVFSAIEKVGEDLDIS